MSINECKTKQNHCGFEELNQLKIIQLRTVSRDAGDGNELLP